MTHNENTPPDGTQQDAASTVDVDEMLRLLPDTQGNIGPAADPESVQRIKLKIRHLMENGPKIR